MNKRITISKKNLTALILSAVFLFPNSIHAATLPITACDSHLVQPSNAFNAHVTTGMSLEDGTKTFAYGANNNFVTATNTVLSFHINLLFQPTNTATIKALALDANCALVFGFGPQFTATSTSEILTVNKDTYETILGGSSQTPNPSGTLRYIWIEVWDGIRGSTVATYSYLVDVNNPQNPTNPAPAPSPPPVPTEPSGKRPVLIIPGIMGSQLYDGNDFIWPNIGLIIDRIHDYFILNSLSLDANGHSIKDISVGDIVKSINISVAGTNINRKVSDSFLSLINSLENNGYISNANYFLLPYDWRLNLDDSVQKLKDKIEAIKAQTGFFKVDIVAHSMGGLLTKDYINQFGSDNINKLIFVGTPHLGAPKSAKVLLEGDTGIPFNLLNKDTIKQLSLNSPSVYELLPNSKYFETYQGYVTLGDANLTLLNYNATKHFLTDKNLNTALLDQADEFFGKSLDNLSYGNAKVYNISGCGLATQAAYSFLPDQTHIISTGYGSGDGTVPLPSADYISTTSKYYAKSVKHSELPSNDAVRQLILGILADNIVPNAKISQTSSFCNFKGKQLVWKSPVAIHIYDQLGNHAGPTTGGGFENNIPGVDYEIINGKKFIFIPSDDGNTYTIKGTGEATGTFDLVISDIDNGTVTSSVVYNDVAITSASQIKVDTTSTDPNVKLDSTGSGNFSDLVSSATVTGNATNDKTAPITSVNETNSTDGAKQIALSASDDNSGVLVIKYALDGVNYQTYNQAIVYSNSGHSKLYYYAIDKAGNDEAIKTLNINITTLSSGGGGGSIPATSEAKGKVLGTTKTATIKDTTLVLDIIDGRTVYIIGNNGQKFAFTSEAVFRKLGYSFNNAMSTDVSGLELGGLIDSAEMAHPNGSLVINNGIIWYINSNKRTALSSMEMFNSFGFSLDQVVPANNFDLKLTEQTIN